ncbi:hypothetical protein, partial [Rhizobium johnstonii]|uniref:hypothetical protein n=1 Tax=Rhizobium johnstonii TaxID=3019933 RepID=UPI003F9CCFDD
VTGIRTSDDGFEVRTSSGTLRTKRIVNAAGAFASMIGAMLGVDVPVFGSPPPMMKFPFAACLRVKWRSAWETRHEIKG